MRTLCVIGLAVVTAGCASQLVVSDASKTALPGVPVGRPVLVRVETQTTYVISPDAPAALAEKLAVVCAPFAEESLEMLPLGETVYIGVAPALLGKAEFDLQFGDDGALQRVSLNSDPQAVQALEGSAALLGAVLPYVAARRPEGEGAGGREATSILELKRTYCIPHEVEVTRITRVQQTP